jgi:hypothetical protein
VGATGEGRAIVVSLPQPSASSTMSSNGRSATRLGYGEAVRCVERRHGIGSARRGFQRGDSKLGWQLGFHYLRIKIHRRTGTIYRASVCRILLQ